MIKKLYVYVVDEQNNHENVYNFYMETSDSFCVGDTFFHKSNLYKVLEDGSSVITVVGIPKYSIGQIVYANWAGGRVTKHTITEIKNTHHGFWYSWKDADSNTGNGLHEHHLSLTR